MVGHVLSVLFVVSGMNGFFGYTVQANNGGISIESGTKIIEPSDDNNYQTITIGKDCGNGMGSSGATLRVNTHITVEKFFMHGNNTLELDLAKGGSITVTPKGEGNINKDSDVSLYGAQRNKTYTLFSKGGQAFNPFDSSLSSDDIKKSKMGLVEENQMSHYFLDYTYITEGDNAGQLSTFINVDKVKTELQGSVINDALIKAQS